jgi:hypothetical protein
MIYVYMQEHCAFNKQIFDVANLTILAPLSLRYLCKLLFLVVDLKISSLHNYDP